MGRRDKSQSQRGRRDKSQGGTDPVCDRNGKEIEIVWPHRDEDRLPRKCHKNIVEERKLRGRPLDRWIREGRSGEKVRLD